MNDIFNRYIGKDVYFLTGTDSLLPFMNVSSEFIPISSWNTNVIVGLNLTLGAYKGRH